MSQVPTLSFGSADGYVVWADFYRVHSMQIVDAPWVSTCVGTLWRRLSPLGLFRLTTLNPTWKGPHTPGGRGLRPGEYLHAQFVETLDAVSATAGGYTFAKADRNPSLYQDNLVWVGVLAGNQARPPNWAGNAAAHELGHCGLPSAGPLSGSGEHTGDPTNVMYGGTLADEPTWNAIQSRAWPVSLDFVRRAGLRYGPDGSGVRAVLDGGRPAWPLN